MCPMLMSMSMPYLKRGFGFGGLVGLPQHFRKDSFPSSVRA